MSHMNRYQIPRPRRRAGSQGCWIVPLVLGLFVTSTLQAQSPSPARNAESGAIERLEQQLESVTGRRQRLDVLVELIGLLRGTDDAQVLVHGAEALALLAVAPDQKMELEIYGALCSAYYQQGQYQETVKACERKVELARQLGDQRAEAAGVDLLGHGYRSLGDYRQALARSNEAVALYTLLGDHRGRGAALNGVGYAYRYLADLGQATSYHLRALQAFEEAEDQAGVGKSLRNIGTLYKQNGLPEKALSVLESALAIQRRLDNRDELGKVLATLGTVRITLGQRDAGLENLEEALRFREQGGDRRGVAIVLSKLGEAYRDSGQLDRAERYFEQVISIHRETGERRREADNLVLLGSVLRRQGAAQRALELIDTAVGMATELGARRNLMEAYRELAETLAVLGQEAAALEAFRQYDQLRTEILSEAAMRSFAEAEVRIKEANELMQEPPSVGDSAVGGTADSEKTSIPWWWLGIAAAVGCGVGFWIRGAAAARSRRGRSGATVGVEEAAIETAATQSRAVDPSEEPTGAELALDPSVDLDAEPGILLTAESVVGGRPGGRLSAIAPCFDEAQSQLVFPDGYVVGCSSAMTNLYQTMETVLGAELTVMIEGETGVGKELVAQILHRSSARRQGPFVPVNCAAIPSELLESEMFGIDKGVATGVSQRQGWFRSAEGGTLFLDEIGEMPILLQAKLLRAVQEKRVHPVGGTEVAVDVWVIAATNQDLMALIEDGKFRSDLFYRLAGALLEVPPLRDCREDLPALVEHFLRHSLESENWTRCGLSRKALDLMRLYGWPGNIRELQNEVRRLASQAADDQLIDSRMLSARIRSVPSNGGGSTASDLPPPEAQIEDTENSSDPPESLQMWDQVKDLERQLILKALANSGQKRREASRLLGISRTTLLRKIREMGIES